MLQVARNHGVRLIFFAGSYFTWALKFDWMVGLRLWRQNRKRICSRAFSFVKWPSIYDCSEQVFCCSSAYTITYGALCLLSVLVLIRMKLSLNQSVLIQNWTSEGFVILTVVLLIAILIHTSAAFTFPWNKVLFSSGPFCHRFVLPVFYFFFSSLKISF